MLVLIKGAGDLASGVAMRLRRAGIHVIMTETSKPTAVRRSVAFCQAVYDGSTVVEDIEGRCVTSMQEAADLMREGIVPVIVAPECSILHDEPVTVVDTDGDADSADGNIRDFGSIGIMRSNPFDAVIDGIMAKRNTGTKITDAPIVLALGPGFTAGVDCHGVIETKRGHTLGRLLTEGSAAPNTGVPGEIGGLTTQRLIRAPHAGTFEPIARIGEVVKPGDPLARVDDTLVTAEISGVVRGILYASLPVTGGMKCGDIDPRCEPEDCYTVSDKALAIGGGALEGLLFFGKSVPEIRKAGIWNG